MGCFASGILIYEPKGGQEVDDSEPIDPVLGRAAERWVLKSPFHLGYLDVLFEFFPDASVIQTHRDPLETIPSVASMYCALWELSTDRVDPLRVGSQCLERYARALERCLEARSRLSTECFLDVDSIRNGEN